jgi:hypothetical protein
MRLLLAVVMGAVMLWGASTATAAQRYAAPAGSGTSCSQAEPCELAEAITKAKSGDEVIVESGTYSVNSPLFPPPEAGGVYIHGDLSAPMPKIVGMTGGVPIGTGNATRLSYLDISNSGSFPAAAICNPGSLIERVRVTAVGEGARGLTINGNCTARDSLVLAEGLASIGVFAYGYSPSTALGTARNLTVIASGEQSTGIAARYTLELTPGEYTLDLENTIASGARADLATLANPWGAANIDVSNSNFDVTDNEAGGTIGGPANQTAPPLFVDAPNGDYREAPGSPTIDGGGSKGVGEFDPEGNPRALGAAPDIGAYEFVPPAPPVARLELLSLSPRRFRAARAGSAVISRRRAPLGSTVKLMLSAATVVRFSVERGLAGRLVGRRCRKPTRANRRRKRCTLWRARRGGFDRGGSAGADSFRFSGRLNGRSLRPGRYRLVAAAGDSVLRAGFRIVP